MSSLVNQHSFGLGMAQLAVTCNTIDNYRDFYRKMSKYYDLISSIKDDNNKAIKEMIGTIGRPRKVLELGVGTGNVVQSLARRGIPVVGIDVSNDMLEIARAKLKKSPCSVVLAANAEDLPFAESQFDAIISFGGPLFMVKENEDMYIVSYMLHKKLNAYLPTLTRQLSCRGTIILTVQNEPQGGCSVKFSQDYEYILEKIARPLRNRAIRRHRVLCKNKQLFEESYLVEKYGMDEFNKMVENYFKIEYRQGTSIVVLRPKHN